MSSGGSASSCCMLGVSALFWANTSGLRGDVGWAVGGRAHAFSGFYGGGGRGEYLNLNAEFDLSILTTQLWG